MSRDIRRTLEGLVFLRALADGIQAGVYSYCDQQKAAIDSSSDGDAVKSAPTPSGNPLGQ